MANIHSIPWNVVENTKNVEKLLGSYKYGNIEWTVGITFLCTHWRICFPFQCFCAHSVTELIFQITASETEHLIMHILRLKTQIINKTKRQPTECKNIFENHISNKGLISKNIKKKTAQLNSKQNKNQPNKKTTQNNLILKMHRGYE